MIKDILVKNGYISIHAPTRGATLDTNGLSIIIGISIHAPTRGATALAPFWLYPAFIFQSTLLQEERRGLLPGLQMN